MPCTITGSTEGDARLAAQEAREGYVKVNSMLCSACLALEAHGIELPPDVKAWWDSHKAIDREREDKEREERENYARLRSTPLSDLADSDIWTYRALHKKYGGSVHGD